jgi:hypothetical protein
MQMTWCCCCHCPPSNPHAQAIKWPGPTEDWLHAPCVHLSPGCYCPTQLQQPFDVQWTRLLSSIVHCGLHRPVRIVNLKTFESNDACDIVGRKVSHLYHQPLHFVNEDIASAKASGEPLLLVVDMLVMC